MSGAAPRYRAPAVVPAALAQVAVELFAARGYDAVSMSEIAIAAGVSRRALFNHFPSKAELVWVSFEPFMHHLDAALEATDPGVPLLTAVQDALLESFDSLGVGLESLRTRLQIVANHPELQVHGASQMAEIRARLQRFVGSRVGAPPDQLELLAIAQALLSVATEAFQQWASSSTDERPDRTLGLMLRAVETAVRPGKGQ